MLTDTKTIPEELYNYYFTHLIIECNWSEYTISDKEEYSARVRETHLSLEEVKKFIVSINKKYLEEIHLIHISEGNGSEDFFKSEIQKLTGVPVYV